MKKIIAATGLALLGAGVLAAPAAAEKVSGQPSCAQIQEKLADELKGLSLQREDKTGNERTSCTFQEARDKPLTFITVKRTDITDGDLTTERIGMKAALKNSTTAEYVEHPDAERIGFAIQNKTGRTEVFANNFMLTMHKVKSGFAPRDAPPLVADRDAQIKALVKLRGQLADRL